MSAKFACIAAHRPRYEVVLMCRVLEVTTSGFYAAQQRAPSAHTRRDEQLLVQIRTAHQKSHRRYGTPRVHIALTYDGARVGKKRIARLMQRDGLRGRRARRFVHTTDATHGEPIAPNTLARQFDVRTVPAPDRVWASDITYVPTREGWLYLAVILDLASRRVVGWAIRRAACSIIPIAAVRPERIPHGVDHPRPHGEHEPAWQLLGQRGGGKFLRDVQGRARVRNRLGDAGRRDPRHHRVHRGVVQPRTAALQSGLLHSSGVRRETFSAPPPHQPRESNLTRCPPNRGNSTLRLSGRRESRRRASTPAFAVGRLQRPVQFRKSLRTRLH
jgi:hypothetical protein